MKLFTSLGGHIFLPELKLVLVSRRDGGNLIVIPSRAVWDRSELTPVELMLWSFLVAATGKAMLDVLPQLEGACINYWDAGNWALNDQAEPKGPKIAKDHRKLHLHLLGRSRTATSPTLQWGEAPKFPSFSDRHSWASESERLSAEECASIVTRVESLLISKYGMTTNHITPWTRCIDCNYPTPIEVPAVPTLCTDCQSPENTSYDQ